MLLIQEKLWKLTGGCINCLIVKIASASEVLTVEIPTFYETQNL